MATRKVLSAKKMPVKKAASKSVSPRKVSTAKTSAKKKQGKERLKVAKAGAAKTKPGEKAPREIDAMRPPVSADKSKKTAVSVDAKIAGVRNEFRTMLKAEIAAAFDVCLSAMEQAANLMESRLVTVLGEMSNLVTGAKPDFKDGKLRSVVSDDGAERTDFSYGDDELVTSRTYRDGKLKFEIVHGKLGNPISGKMFDSSGKIVKEFSYGPDGQVK